MLGMFKPKSSYRASAKSFAALKDMICSIRAFSFDRFLEAMPTWEQDYKTSVPGVISKLVDDMTQYVVQRGAFGSDPYLNKMPSTIIAGRVVIPQLFHIAFSDAPAIADALKTNNKDEVCFDICKLLLKSMDQRSSEMSPDYKETAKIFITSFASRLGKPISDLVALDAAH